MTDDLRTRISAIAGEHRFADHQTAFGDKCVCGWTSQGIAHSDHLADAVIRELGLTREQRELMDGMCGQSINYTTGKVTNHYRAATKQHRYVTEWTADE